MQETQETLGLEHCLEEETETHSSSLPEKSHGQRNLKNPMDRGAMQRVGHD